MQDKVLNAELPGTVKRVSASQETYEGKTLIIASGSMGRTLTIPGEERLLGAGVSYCATCDGAFYRDQQVAVAGNNQEAVEEALFLTRFARHVHLLVQTPDLRVSPDLADEVRHHPQITVCPSTRLREVLGQMQVEGVQIVEQGGAEQTLPARGVFIYLQGGKPITDFLYDQLETTDAGCLSERPDIICHANGSPTLVTDSYPNANLVHRLWEANLGILVWKRVMMALCVEFFVHTTHRSTV